MASGLHLNSLVRISRSTCWSSMGSTPNLSSNLAARGSFSPSTSMTAPKRLGSLSRKMPLVVRNSK